MSERQPQGHESQIEGSESNEGSERARRGMDTTRKTHARRAAICSWRSRAWIRRMSSMTRCVRLMRRRRRVGRALVVGHLGLAAQPCSGETVTLTSST